MGTNYPRAQFAPNAKSVVIFDARRRVLVFDARSGAQLAILALPSAGEDGGEASPSARFTADGSSCFIMKDGGELRRYETTRWRPVGEPMQHPTRGYDYHFDTSPDGMLAATFDSDGDCGQTGHLQIWDAIEAVPLGKPSPISRVGPRFLERSRRLVLSGWTSSATIHDLPAVTQPFALPQHGGDTCITFSADEAWVMTWGEGGLDVLDAATGEPQATLATAEVLHVVASPKAREISALLDDTPRNVKALHQLRLVAAKLPGLGILASIPLEAPGSSRPSVTLSPDGRRLLMRCHSSAGDRLRIFDAEGLEELGPGASEPCRLRLEEARDVDLEAVEQR